MTVEDRALRLLALVTAVTSVFLLTSGCADPSDEQTGGPSLSGQDYLLTATDSDVDSRILYSISQFGGQVTAVVAERGVILLRSADAGFVESLNGIDGVLDVVSDPGLVDIFPADDADAQSSLELPNTHDDDELYNLQWSHAAMDVPLAWSLGVRGAGG